MQSDQTKVPGMLTVEDLRTAAGNGSIDTVILALPDPYGKLMGKRLDASYFLTDVASGTHACNPGPVYSAAGRMSLLSARCSKTCADQPVMREHTKMGVKRWVGIPMKWYMLAE